MITVDGIPAELRQRRQWVCWRYEQRGGESTKVPYRADGAGKAKSDDPATWATFEEARDASEARKHNGVGYMFSQDDPYTGVDLDHCRHPVTGAVTPEAIDIMAALDSYTEISPSGTGLHIIVRGKLPPGRRRAGAVEMYDGGRYFCVTGNHLEGAAATIEERSEELTGLHGRLFPPEEMPEPVRSAGIPADDGELLARARAAKNGSAFARLFDGDWSTYPSQSEADLALCSHLAFYAGGDRSQIDRLFRSSGLMRAKWVERHGEKTYGEMTVERALGGPTAAYTAGQRFSGNGKSQKTAECPHCRGYTADTCESCGVPYCLDGLREHEAGCAGTPDPLDDADDDDEEPLRFPRTDAGNGELFAHLYGDRLRFDHRRKRWLVWAGHWWQPDADAQVRLLAKQAARQRYQQAAIIDDLKDREKAAKWSIDSESRMRMDATLSLAQAEPPIADSGERWDTDPWLLGVANGVVDLRTGQLRAGRQDDRITMHSAVAFDPGAKCPRWEMFLQEVFASDEGLADYIWRAMGYSLTAITREQVLFISWGSGWNGKSTFKAVQENLLGDYAANTPFSTLEYSGRYSIPNDVAALHGKRVVTASEINEGRRLNEARIKALAGEDTMTGRFLYGEHFTFKPQAKFWLSVNHKPLVNDDSSGFWRKVRLLPFSQSFEGRCDPHLETKLRAEYPGILAWMVRGCLEWQQRGLEAPDIVKAATLEYRTESDPLAAFIAEACTLNPDATTKASNLYKRYKSWAEDSGLGDRERLSSTKFGAVLGSRFTKRHTEHGTFYDGIDGLGSGA